MRPSTTIDDLHGMPHRYECEEFGFTESLNLGLEIAGIIGGPVGEAFKGLLMGSELADTDLDDKALAQLPAMLGDLPTRILQAGGASLVARILRGCQRTDERTGADGKPETFREWLKEPKSLDNAYKGGNLMESFKAVGWVLRVHYGPFLMGVWGDLRPLLAELGTRLMESQKPQEETPNQKPSGEPMRSSLKPTEIIYSTSSTPT